MNFLIRRVQNYLAANGLNIYDENPSNYFEYNNYTNEFVIWKPTIPRPSIEQLVIDYPDSVIAKEIALRQLRAYRNVMLIDTDKFVIIDFPGTLQFKTELAAWRQALRHLPETISDDLLVLNQYDRLDLNGIFPPPPDSATLNKLRQKFPFLV